MSYDGYKLSWTDAGMGSTPATPIKSNAELTEDRVSEYWTSQVEARAIVAKAGCKICTWQYPGEIMDVAGDLWCHHCVREFDRQVTNLNAAKIR